MQGPEWLDTGYLDSLFRSLYYKEVDCKKFVRSGCKVYGEFCADGVGGKKYLLNNFWEHVKV